jgi:hypothetical protein
MDVVMDISVFWLKVEIFSTFFAPLCVLGAAMLLARFVKGMNGSARHLWKGLR